MSLPLRYSQNFLHSPRLVERLLSLSSVSREDVVYEIGPGKGAITDCLARHCRRVVAIEKDCALAESLRRRYASCERVTIHTGDFLDFALPERPYKVFASIPFAITHEIVTKLTAAKTPPLDAYLIMQREAAEKFCGVPRGSLYAALLAPWFETTIVHHFRRSDFTPSPRVDVVMLRLNKRGPPLVAPCERQRQMYRDFVVYAFVAHTPTLSHTLKDILSYRQHRQIMDALHLDPCATPTDITPLQWIHLFQFFRRMENPHAKYLISGSERRLRQQQAKLHKVHRTRAAPAKKRVKNCE